MRRVIAMLAFIFLIAAAAPSVADPIEFALAGTITSVDGVAVGTVGIGDTWSGFLSWDTDAMRFADNYFPGALSVNFAGLTFWTDAVETYLHQSSSLQLDVGDTFENAEGPAVGGDLPAELLAQLVFTDGVFTDPTQLPASIDPAVFDTGWFSLSVSPGGWQNETATGHVRGEIASLVQVPEPASALLFGAGMIAAGAAARRWLRRG